MLQLLLKYGALERKSLTDLRWVLFAGEVLPITALEEFMLAIPTASYANLYGPTETNVVTYHLVPPLSAMTSSLPIGVPCAHSDVRICDPKGDAVPDGEIGEICVFGPTVMHGYWMKPEETKASRVCGRVASYRTGDIGRVDADGTIYFLGRKDLQIKVRGYRVDMAEIENVALQSKLVESAVVTVNQPGTVQARLLLFVVAAQKDDFDPAVLRHFLSGRLPKQCLPDEIRLRDDMPRTSTGKIDRRRLSMESEPAERGRKPGD